MTRVLAGRLPCRGVLTIHRRQRYPLTCRRRRRPPDGKDFGGYGRAETKAIAMGAGSLDARRCHRLVHLRCSGGSVGDTDVFNARRRVCPVAWAYHSVAVRAIYDYEKRRKEAQHRPLELPMEDRGMNMLKASKRLEVS